jgi:hypothetical protein
MGKQSTKTIIYRYLKQQGLEYAAAYDMATELAILLDTNR